MIFYPNRVISLNYHRSSNCLCLSRVLTIKLVKLTLYRRKCIVPEKLVLVFWISSRTNEKKKKGPGDFVIIVFAKTAQRNFPGTAMKYRPRFPSVRNKTFCLLRTTPKAT